MMVKTDIFTPELVEQIGTHFTKVHRLSKPGVIIELDDLQWLLNYARSLPEGETPTLEQIRQAWAMNGRD